MESQCWRGFLLSFSLFLSLPPFPVVCFSSLLAFLQAWELPKKKIVFCVMFFASFDSYSSRLLSTHCLASSFRCRSLFCQSKSAKNLITFRFRVEASGAKPNHRKSPTPQDDPFLFCPHCLIQGGNFMSATQVPWRRCKLKIFCSCCRSRAGTVQLKSIAWH